MGLRFNLIEFHSRGIVGGDLVQGGVSVIDLGKENGAALLPDQVAHIQMRVFLLEGCNGVVASFEDLLSWDLEGRKGERRGGGRDTVTEGMGCAGRCRNCTLC